MLRLGSLVTSWLTNCGLRELPAELGELRSLESLFLGSNLLKAGARAVMVVA
jgi:hypothetical protein